MTSPRHPARVRAPELRGRRWLNTGGAELSIAGLRGKIVLLDFWTFCCVNCLHVLDELRELEERFADVLVTLGVHSPKFVHEADPDAVAAAVERHGVHHPVLDDPELRTWDAYAARAWPTLVVVDPRGYVVAQLAGEGHAHGLGVLIEELVAEFLVVAMAGNHQLWSFSPATGAPRVLAGTTNEGLRDGPVGEAFFAQPSGLAADGDTLWLADAETSALRSLVAAPAVGAAVTTSVGQGLFDFGHRDGPAAEALLQHPLGVAVLPDGSVAVADTYNGAVRRYDPATGVVGTLARDLAEPSDVLVDGDTLVVVESAAHRLTRLPVPASTRVDAGAHRVRRARTDLAPGVLALRIGFVPPTGQHLDDRFGDPTSLTVAAAPPGLLAAGSGTAPGLTRELRFAPDGPAEGVLQVSVAAAACDEGGGTFAACHRYQQDWGIPVRLVPGAPAELALDLRAVHG
ncbi:MAG TPA: thioredoxin-like domain-containing protein [Pseudonocardia sp.]